MKYFYLIIVSALFVLNVRSQNKMELKSYWDNGLKFSGENKDFSIKIGGRLQYDVMAISQDSSLDSHFDANNGAEFRRARLYTSGTVYNFIKYKFQVDFAGNVVALKDAYLTFTKIPWVGNLTVGNFKEPRGFEMITSSKYITMMERSLTNVYDNDRNLGFMIHNQFLSKRLSFYAGYFYPSGKNAKYNGSEYDITFRIVGLPIFKDETDNYKVLHIDAGLTHEYHDYQELSYSARPESHLAPKYLKVNIDETKSINEYNSGLVAIYNQFSFEGEYTYADVIAGPNSILQESNYGFSSFYGTLSWFISGEHKNYSKSKVGFEKISPKKNFGVDGGLGALELAIRYSVLNLNDKDVQGGKMNNITVGLNWYLNPVTKVTVNYVHSDVYKLGLANIYQLRFQLAF